MKNAVYNDKFYSWQGIGSVNSAAIILPKVFEVLPKINSIVDFGCGTGTWLSIANNLGVSEVCGLDGSWVNKEMLKIPKECFLETNLDKEVLLEKKYDLAISLEVAEHISPESAELFVESLVKASDIVLFSAAIPFQGGLKHINEQWPEYWINIFAKNGYVVMDFLRKQIWNDKNVEFWYKQNIILFVKKDICNRITIPSDIHTPSPLSLVHPELYLLFVNRDVYRISWKDFFIAIIKRILKRF